MADETKSEHIKTSVAIDVGVGLEPAGHSDAAKGDVKVAGHSDAAKGDVKVDEENGKQLPGNGNKVELKENGDASPLENQAEDRQGDVNDHLEVGGDEGGETSPLENRGEVDRQGDVNDHNEGEVDRQGDVNDHNEEGGDEGGDGLPLENQSEEDRHRDVNDHHEVGGDEGGETSLSSTSEKGASTKTDQDEIDPFSDLKENEKKALEEFRSRIEEAVLMNELLKKKPREQKEESDQKARSKEEESKKSEVGDHHEIKKESEEGEKPHHDDERNADKGKAKVMDNEEYADKKENVNYHEGEFLSLWGVPLMPSAGDKGTDVILLKFLRARDFKVNDALEMLRSTLEWRKENNIDTILEEDFGTDYGSMASVNGVDRRGHPVCYNVYGVFGNDDLYNKTFGKQECREKFLRWRLQLMERQIKMLDFWRFGKGAASSLLQINDLKDTPGPSRKDLRVATRQAVALLQDNYPEFVARNIFINVPFWYYAFNALLSPFLTQRTKSKFVFARTNRVTETLLKYIAAEEIPVKYGGLKREDDPDFSTDDVASDITVKAGSTEVIEIPATKAGSTSVWDLTVIGWEVNYKEEFVPSDDGSYTVIVKKERRIGGQEGSVRNSFRNNEPGKIVLTIENGQFTRKRVLYRFKTKDT